MFYDDQVAAMAPGEPGTFFVARRAAARDSPSRRTHDAASDVGSARHRGLRFTTAGFPARSRAGRTGWLEVAPRPRQVLGVAASAVLQSPEGPYVLAWSGHGYTFDKRPIEIGETFFKEGIAVVLSGLAPHDRVVGARHLLRRRGSPPGRPTPGSLRWMSCRDCPAGLLVRPPSLDGHRRRRWAWRSAGELARRGLARDVIPDLADPQIGLVADWMGHPAPEVAATVTQRADRGARRTCPVPRRSAARRWPGWPTSTWCSASADGLDAAPAEIVGAPGAARAPRCRPTFASTSGRRASSTGWVFEYALTDPRAVSSPLRAAPVPGGRAPPGAGRDPGRRRGRLGRRRSSAGADRRQAARAARARPGVHRRRCGAAARVRRPARPGARRRRARSPISRRCRARRRRRCACATSRWCALTEDMPTGLADLAGRPRGGGYRHCPARREHRDARRPGQAHDRPRGAQAAPPRRGSGAARLRRRRRRPRLDHLRSLGPGDARARTLLRALGEEIGVVVLVILMFLLHARSALVPLVTLPFVCC